MKRHASALLTITWLMAGMVSLTVGGARAAAEVATLKSVTLSAHDTSQELVLLLDGPYTYKTVQAAPNALFIDVAGAQAAGFPHHGVWSNPSLAGYKILQYQDASGQPVVRVEVDTTRAEPFVARQDAKSLRLVFGDASPLGAAVTPVVASTVEMARVNPPAVRAQSPDRPSGPLVVSNVIVDKREPGQTFVDVVTSRTPTYRVMSFKNPPRLVVDLDSAQYASHPKSFPADTALLRDVRLAQFHQQDPAVVRVVADLTGDPAFDVHSTAAGLRIELRPRGRAESAQPEKKSSTLATDIKPPTPPGKKSLAPATDIKSPAPAKNKSLAADERPAAQPDKKSPTLATDIKSPAPSEKKSLTLVADVKPPAPPEKKPLALVAEVKLPAAPLVEPVVVPAAVAVFPERVARPPVATVPLSKETEKVNVQSALPPADPPRQVAAAPLPPPAGETPDARRAANAAQTLTPAKGGLKADPQATQPTPYPPSTQPPSTFPPSEERPVYTGEPISLNLKDVDLKDFSG